MYNQIMRNLWLAIAVTLGLAALAAVLILLATNWLQCVAFQHYFTRPATPPARAPVMALLPMAPSKEPLGEWR